MDINSLNYGGIEAQTSMSEAAKSMYLQGQQLAEQKKQQIEEPFDLIGSELLRGGIEGLGKNLVKKTGIKAFQNLGKEDLSKTIANVLKESGNKLTGKITTEGKKQFANLINKELTSRGYKPIDTDSITDTTSLKELLQNKIKNETAVAQKDLPAKARKAAIDKLDQQKQKAQGRDVGEGLDEDDKNTMKILGDLQQETKRNVMKKQATKYTFDDKGIENIGKSIDDEDELPLFSSKERQPIGDVGAPDSTITEARVLDPFSTSTQAYQPQKPNVIESEATTADFGDDIEQTYRSLHQNAISKSIRAQNPVQKVDKGVDFLQPKVTKTQYEAQAKQNLTGKAKASQLPDIEGIGTGETIAEKGDKEILQGALERTNRGLAQQALEQKGKLPSALFTKAENIRDPLPGDLAQLGRTTAKVKAESQLPKAPLQVETQGEQQFRQGLQDEGKTFESVFQQYKPPPQPRPSQQPNLGTIKEEDETQQPPKEEPKLDAPPVDEDEEGIESGLKKLAIGVGDADLATGGMDLLGDLAEGVLGVASLVIPSLIHEGVNKPVSTFSSSLQAGATNI